MEARGSLLLFVPMLLGTGIGLWFGWPWEPGRVFYLVFLGLALAGLAARIWAPEPVHAPAIAVFCLCLGVLAAGFRGHFVASPVIDIDYSGPIQGRVIEIDRSGSDALRVTLDQVWLAELPPERTPAKVRVSFQGIEPDLVQGSVILVSARLSAPPGAVEPGAFDFRRMAWFDGLGAIGYTRTSPVLWSQPRGAEEWVGRLRQVLSQAIRDGIGGEAGAFAAGSLTGDRSGIGPETVEALRDSNLAHLLAISGANLAILTGFVFFLFRGGIALIPPLALRINAKKVAAVVALGVSAFYLALSGANVSTQRAFIMIVVMLGAVMLDRKAISLRSVAISAIVLLLWQPESLTEPGFQLSFAATIGLVVGFRWLDGRTVQEKLPRWILPLYALFLSSAVAGAATAPYSALHFNRFTDYGLLANLLTVPAMSLVMAGGVLAALLGLVGLAGPVLWVVGKSATWILWVAHLVADLEGAVTPIPAPHWAILPLFTIGMLWLVAWPGRSRWAGVVPAVLALVLWPLSPRPLVLIDDKGGMVGVLGPEGRALSRAKGSGFAAENWLANDGDLAEQKIAATRPGLIRQEGLVLFDFSGRTGALVPGPEAEIAALCAKLDLIITDQTLTGDPAPGSCLILDAATLAQSGSVAIWETVDGPILVQSRQAHRLWSGPAAPSQPLTLPNQ